MLWPCIEMVWHHLLFVTDGVTEADFTTVKIALTLGSSHVVNLSLHQTAWYGVILQNRYRHWHVTGKNRNIKAAAQWLENKISLIHHPEKSRLKRLEKPAQLHLFSSEQWEKSVCMRERAFATCPGLMGTWKDVLLVSMKAEKENRWE